MPRAFNCWIAYSAKISIIYPFQDSDKKLKTLASTTRLKVKKKSKICNGQTVNILLLHKQSYTWAHSLDMIYILSKTGLFWHLNNFVIKVSLFINCMLFLLWFMKSEKTLTFFFTNLMNHSKNNTWFINSFPFFPFIVNETW